MASENALCAWVICAVVPLCLCLIRVIAVLPALRDGRKQKSHSESDIPVDTSLMIFLGSGGHTGEMLRLLENTDISQCHRTWLVSSGDAASLMKAKKYEESTRSFKNVNYAELHRARKVGESLALSTLSTIKSIFSTVQQLSLLPKPDILLVNGPGTSVPIAYTLFFMSLFGGCKTKIVYIESLARVHNLSLSGRLIMPIANRFLVQWAPLAFKYQRAEYYGILI
ncbi:Alg14-domain-containing protein [Metschnikowia bicuspidata var. bicuspidata NRRL YB-4993]|uniref:UDP-N-acetylglucosamine transferase subunit ALG14 n=1 Tax=Metschnikowia bicuspidata var. bicuspidata NRRL YB-4993 TaxID=869754 RepID=A0A1A0H506_9ASCO|nr:Alg14-domain-containing protein [Metschnikowia bicuspidata var. bicuspidata NRRL YB-4993]OBA18992.1 Alg14-domain-containing protein [Metschnikowia bicuspidata var. bicuspidata NRRL YB-4993]